MRTHSFYKKINTFAAKNRCLSAFVKIADKVIVVGVSLSYLLLLISLFVGRSDRLVQSLLIPAISFVCVSLLRCLVDRERPYENQQLQEILKAQKKGRSFPSRHVFSASVIAATFYPICPALSVTLFAAAILLAICRVLGGVHYISDVLFGLVLGVSVGILYLFF